MIHWLYRECRVGSLWRVLHRQLGVQPLHMKYMLLAAVFMGCILVPLVAIVVDQYNIVTSIIDQQSSSSSSSNGSTLVSWKDYLLLQFPFEIHLGWIAAAFALNINVLVVASGASAKTQCAVAGVSLAILTIVSGACLFAMERPQYTFVLVAIWATVSSHTIGRGGDYISFCTHLLSVI